MWIVLAAVAGVVGLINLAQVFIGRQLIRPSASRRSALEIRQQSAAAAVAMLGVSLIGLHVFWGLLPVLLGYSALVLLLLKKRASKR
ncbi:hypothetical protein [Kitasatospora sp. NPDC057015]|uniref:hypothetical protein n=1 Tax=Kitasatospora sp. NPDC057015 TaxID=3346001 RepID=UPI0036325CDB